MKSCFCLFVLLMVGCGQQTQSSKNEAPAPPITSATVVTAKSIPDASAVPLPQKKKVLITIDDIPVAMRSVYTPKERVAVARGICDVLERNGAPAVAFANMVHAKADRDALEIWKSCAGVTIGNHTWSHPRLAKVGLDAYLKDLERGHNAVKKIVPTTQPIYFRYPYLREGEDPTIRDAIRDLLTELKSPHLPVTIETMDWYYAKRYAEARKAGHVAREGIQRQTWQRDVEEATLEAEWYSDLLFGEQAPQVVLLHANLLNAEHLDDYLVWLKDRGYAFVTAEEVLAHSAYREVVEITSPKGETRWKSLYRDQKKREATSR